MSRTRSLGAAALFALWATGAPAASLSLQKGPLILGQDTEVGVTVRVDEPPGTDPDLPLLLEVNVGSFGPVSRVGPGVFKTRYRLPGTLFPQVALVAAWRETGPDAPVDFLRIPLYGVTYVPVKARPGAEVTIRVGLDPTPPVVVGRSGRAEVEVAVPPGIDRAQVSMREKKGGPLTTRQVPIEVPPYNRLTAALVPQAVLADGESWARLELFYDMPGKVLPPDQVTVRPSVGAVSFEGVRNGRHVYRYQPPADTAEPDVSFRVTLAEDAAAQAKARLSLRLPPPSRIVVRPPAQALVADGKSKGEVVVQVYAASGLTLPRQEVTLAAAGQPLGKPAYRGQGRYGFEYRAPPRWPPNGEVVFQASVKGAPGPAEARYRVEPAAVPAAMVARFSPDPVPADGRTEAELTLAVSDAAGRPLRGAQLAIQTSAGKVVELSELGDGIYRARYVAPPSSDGAALQIRDASGQFDREFPVPLREDPRHVLIGLRGGAAYAPGDLARPRVGLDLVVPLRLGGVYLLAGLAVTGGMAQKELSDPAVGFTSKSQALFAPASARIGCELFATRRWSFQLGAGALFTAARFSNDATGEVRHGYSFGAVGFGAASFALGPGHLFGELSYSWAPVRAGDFVLEAGGAGAEAGYRIALN